MPVEIHALVEYTHHIDATRRHAVKQDMRADWMFSISLSHMIARSSALGRLGDQGDRVGDAAKISLRLIVTPALSRVIPNLIHVGLRPRRENKAAHFAAEAGLRLPAMNASKSKGSEAPLVSPSIKAA